MLVHHRKETAAAPAGSRNAIAVPARI